MSVRPDHPCPCGSGKKFKKCCAKGKRRAASFTSADRESALVQLSELYEELVAPDVRRAVTAEYWGDLLPREGEDELALAMTHFAHDFWRCFDIEMDDGFLFAEVALAEGDFSDGEEAFVEAALASVMRPYEVTAVRPGQSLTLRDLLDGSIVEVRERSASRSLHRWDVIATRVFAIGASGRPELDGGLFPIARSRRDPMIGTVRAELARLRAEDPEASDLSRHKLLGPLYHAASRQPLGVPLNLTPFGGQSDYAAAAAT